MILDEVHILPVRNWHAFAEAKVVHQEDGIPGARVGQIRAALNRIVRVQPQFELGSNEGSDRLLAEVLGHPEPPPSALPHAVVQEQAERVASRGKE
jgi:hypothetical protein